MPPAYCPLRELRPLVQQLRAKHGPRPHEIHAEILWRVQRGELLTLPALCDLYPIRPERLQGYVDQLVLWGYVELEDGRLQLVLEP